MSVKFELEAMRIALGDMLERIGRIEREVASRQKTDEDITICGECREAAPGGSTVVGDSTVSALPSGAAVAYKK